MRNIELSKSQPVADIGPRDILDEVEAQALNSSEAKFDGRD